MYVWIRLCSYPCTYACQDKVNQLSMFVRIRLISYLRTSLCHLWCLTWRLSVYIRNKYLFIFDRYRSSHHKGIRYRSDVSKRDIFQIYSIATCILRMLKQNIFNPPTTGKHVLFSLRCSCSSYNALFSFYQHLYVTI